MRESEIETAKASFFATIRADPTNNDNRLVFADWAEQHDLLQLAAMLRGGSEKWLREFAPKVDLDYEELMELASRHVDNMAKGGFWDGITEYGSESWRNAFYANDEAFWRHFEVMTGVNGKEAGSPFSCSC